MGDDGAVDDDVERLDAEDEGVARAVGVGGNDLAGGDGALQFGEGRDAADLALGDGGVGPGDDVGVPQWAVVVGVGAIVASLDYTPC